MDIAYKFRGGTFIVIVDETLGLSNPFLKEKCTLYDVLAVHYKDPSFWWNGTIDVVTKKTMADMRRLNLEKPCSYTFAFVARQVQAVQQFYQVFLSEIRRYKGSEGTLVDGWWTWPEEDTHAPEPMGQPAAQPEAEALYKTLAEAYTRIEGLSCRGPAWMLERDIRLCKAFCARWNGAQQDPQTAALLREKVRFVDYSDEFLLPGFGRRGRIPGHRASGDLLEDLSAAVLKQTARQQTALEAALRAQKWFEGVKKQIRHIQPEPADVSAPASRPEYTPPDATPLTRKTAPESLETFYVLAFKTTGKSPSRDEIAQAAVLKFRRFAPESVLSAYVKPEKGLTKYARESGVTERMTQDAPKLAQLLPAIDAYLDEQVPLVLFRADDLAFLAAAGSEAICAKRPVYDVRTLTGHRTASLADACGAMFEFVPELGSAEDEALACGLLFCGLADRTLHLTAKR